MPKTMRKTSLKIQMLAGNSFISRPDSDSQKKLPLVYNNDTGVIERAALCQSCYITILHDLFELSTAGLFGFLAPKSERCCTIVI